MRERFEMAEEEVTEKVSMEHTTLNDTADSTFDLSDCANTNADITKSAEKEPSPKEEKVEAGDAVEISSSEPSPVKPPSRLVTFIRDMLPFLLGICLFLGLVYGCCCLLGPPQPDIQMDQAARLAYILKLIVLLFVPLTIASAVSIVSQDEKHTRFFREALDSSILLCVNIAYAATHVPVEVLHVIPAIMATVTLLRFLQWCVMDQCWHYRCMFGSPVLFQTILLTLYNMREMLGCAGTLSLMENTQPPTPEPPAQDISGGWF